MRSDDPGLAGSLALGIEASASRLRLDRLVQDLEPELEAIAAVQLRRRTNFNLLEPVELVSELYLKLAGSSVGLVTDRSHLLAIAARAVRQVLIDHLRARHRNKRGAGQQEIRTRGSTEPSGTPGDCRADVLSLRRSLEELARYDKRKAQVVYLRYVLGMTIEETAVSLSVCPNTVIREWMHARAWLRDALSGSTRL